MHDCTKNPPGLNKEIRSLSHTAGLVVYGFFPRPYYWGPIRWRSVSVSVDSRIRGSVYQFGPRALTLPLNPGRFRVTLSSDGAGSHSTQLDLAEGDVALLTFKSPNWWVTEASRRPCWYPARLVQA